MVVKEIHEGETLKKIKNILRSLRRKDEAVAGIIVAVMIVGLILAVISIVQSLYVPKWMEAREAEHMGAIADQFSQLAYAIDSQAALKQPFPISTSITLGSKELGFLMSNKAFGRLSIVPNGGSYLVGLQIGSTSTGDFGVLHYSSENVYFINQNYNYEGGALILNQSEGSVFAIEPTFTVNNYKSAPIDPRVNITWSCINLQPTGDKLSISGYGTYPVRTKYSSFYNSTMNNQSIHYIQITTSYPTLWARFLNSTFASANLQYGLNNDYTISETSDTVTISFPPIPPNAIPYYLNLQVVTISAQLAPGWIGS
jgi:hypothetical protein